MKYPNGPKTHPFLLMLKWVLRPTALLEACAAEYGEIFSIPLAISDAPLVLVSNPQAVQEILTNDTKTYSAPGKINEILKPLIGEQSVILIDGDRHRRQRQLLLPPFHGERMRNYGETILEITQQATQDWIPGTTFNARTITQKITLNVILQAVFGFREGERYQQIRTVIEQLCQSFNLPWQSSMLFWTSLQKDLGAWSPWGQFLRQRQKIDELLYAEIAERQANPDPNRTDILNLMMAARDEEGQPMTHQELRDELMTLLFAGHETTATALAWALYWTHRLPEVRQKVIAEVESLGKNPDPMAIFRLPYLTAVCNETLRIYPVAMLTFPRVPQVPVELLGYSIDPGTLVMGCIYLTHRREDLYPDHTHFKPERFLERQYSPYEFYPFGGGVRRCIGMALAQFEMKLVLAQLLTDWNLDLTTSRPIVPARRGVTLSPAGGIPMVVKGKRESSIPFNRVYSEV